MKCERRLNLSLGICVVSLLAAAAIDHQWETIEAAMLMNVWRLMFTCVYKGKSKVRSAISHDLKMAKRDLSGNTVWPQASGLQKIPKMDHFGYFCETFVHSKCKRSSLRWQFWMRLFLLFSITVLCVPMQDFMRNSRCRSWLYSIPLYSQVFTISILRSKKL